MERRAEFLEAAKKSTKDRAMIREMCRRDVCFFIDYFCYTYDPRRDGQTTIPMVLFPKQKEYLIWIANRRHKREHGIVEKSRDMGLSWLNMQYGVWGWLFEDGVKFTYGSRKRDYVDQRGNMDSLFEKARFTISRLPDWMIPKHIDKQLVLLNKDNGALITGEASSEAGRGGRSSAYFLDEAAFVESAEKVDSAISQNTETVISGSTPNGVANLFYRKRFSGKYPVFTFNYTDHPAKDEAWLEEQKAKLEEVVVAREILIDYFASRERVLFPHKWMEAAIDFYAPGGGKRVAGLDVADEGGYSNCFAFRQNNELRFVESWKLGTTTETAQRARNLCEEHKIESLQYDSNGVGAGVRGELKQLGQKRALRFRTIPINFGCRASDREYARFDGRKGFEVFDNIKAELFWLLRLRFERTFEVCQGIGDHSIDETISIPNDPEILAQLGCLQFDFTTGGLITVTSKKQLRKDGIKSPDKADAIAYAFAENEVTIWW